MSRHVPRAPRARAHTQSLVIAKPVLVPRISPTYGEIVGVARFPEVSPLRKREIWRNSVFEPLADQGDRWRAINLLGLALEVVQPTVENRLFKISKFLTHEKGRNLGAKLFRPLTASGLCRRSGAPRVGYRCAGVNSAKAMLPKRGCDSSVKRLVGQIGAAIVWAPNYWSLG
jgi:hypothetical protein